MVPDTISGLGSFGGLGNLRVVPIPVIGAGYFAGGQGASLSNVVDKLAFSDESRSTLVTGLSASRASIQGFANSGVAGYVAGSNVSGRNIDKFNFLNDSRSTISDALSAARNNPNCFSNSGTAGYIAGGDLFSTLTEITKISFPGDSISILGTGLTVAREAGAAFANSGTAGYAAGGANRSAGRLNSIAKLIFSNDSNSTIVATLSNSFNFPAGYANSGTAGYISGGSTNAITLNSINKIKGNPIAKIIPIIIRKIYKVFI